MTDNPPAPAPSPKRPRPAPGERRLQILQALAAMLEQPAGDRVTTAAMAHRLGVSEAALYRHFASKAQMFEGLIDFTEQSLMALVQQVDAREPHPLAQTARIAGLTLQFAEANPGLARVLAGDALVQEHPRLQTRVNRLWDKLEAVFKQRLREAGVRDPVAVALVVQAFLVGRLQGYVRRGFQRNPTEHLEACLQALLPPVP